jgi:hypothetical protein
VIKLGDLVQFRMPLRDSEKGAFLVARVEGNMWILLQDGPAVTPHNAQTLYNWNCLEAVQ